MFLVHRKQDYFNNWILKFLKPLWDVQKDCIFK